MKYETDRQQIFPKALQSEILSICTIKSNLLKQRHKVIDVPIATRYPESGTGLLISYMQ